MNLKCLHCKVWPVYCMYIPCIHTSFLYSCLKFPPQSSFSEWTFEIIHIAVLLQTIHPSSHTFSHHYQEVYLEPLPLKSLSRLLWRRPFIYLDQYPLLLEILSKVFSCSVTITSWLLFGISTTSVFGMTFLLIPYYLQLSYSNSFLSVY